MKRNEKEAQKCFQADEQRKNYLQSCELSRILKLFNEYFLWNEKNELVKQVFTISDCYILEKTLDLQTCFPLLIAIFLEKINTTIVEFEVNFSKLKTFFLIFISLTIF